MLCSIGSHRRERRIVSPARGSPTPKIILFFLFAANARVCLYLSASPKYLIHLGVQLLYARANRRKRKLARPAAPPRARSPASILASPSQLLVGYSCDLDFASATRDVAVTAGARCIPSSPQHKPFSEPTSLLDPLAAVHCCCLLHAASFRPPPLAHSGLSLDRGAGL